MILLKNLHFAKIWEITKMINQAQKIDCRAFVGEIYFRFFRNRLIQQNHVMIRGLERQQIIRNDLVWSEPGLPICGSSG